VGREGMSCSEGTDNPGVPGWVGFKFGERGAMMPSCILSRRVLVLNIDLKSEGLGRVSTEVWAPVTAFVD
jgi:hypothetical protein